MVGISRQVGICRYVSSVRYVIGHDCSYLVVADKDRLRGGCRGLRVWLMAA